MKGFDWKFVGSALMGLIITVLTVYALESLRHELYPPFTGQPENVELINNYISGAPFWSLVMVPLSWIIGAFCGTLLASLVHSSKKRSFFFIIAGLTTIAACMMLIQYPSPWYFWILAMFIFPSSLLASRLVRSAEV
ncbi:MAG: hypothetical protein ACI8ZN_001848 [Bacteroidia bacterium]|jgi:hypothetical protein